MTPRWLLRLAALFLFLMALGHTLGGMLLPTSHGVQEDMLLRGLAAYHFDMMGFSRSHADFYRGEGWYLSLSVILFAALCWVMSNLTTTHPKIVRSLLLVPALFCLGSIVLCILYFFTAPLATSLLAFIAIAWAGWKLRAKDA